MNIARNILKFSTVGNTGINGRGLANNLSATADSQIEVPPATDINKQSRIPMKFSTAGNAGIDGRSVSKNLSAMAATHEEASTEAEGADSKTEAEKFIEADRIKRAA